jgi:hypothetical protein
MNKRVVLLGLLLLVFPGIGLGEEGHLHTSKYAGEEKRAIKSLSESDVEELSNGRGWGLAKAAELNGVPGPVHLLEMKEEINLSVEQIEKIEAIYVKMKKQAVKLGVELIELEGELNDHFARGTITDKILRELLNAIEVVRRDLRYTHLSAHLETPSVLSAEQIKLYNELRGYAKTDPCENIPDGHNAEMWKKHNNCK